MPGFSPGSASFSDRAPAPAPSFPSSRVNLGFGVAEHQFANRPPRILVFVEAGMHFVDDGRDDVCPPRQFIGAAGGFDAFGDDQAHLPLDILQFAPLAQFLPHMTGCGCGGSCRLR